MGVFFVHHFKMTHKIGNADREIQSAIRKNLEQCVSSNEFFMFSENFRNAQQQLWEATTKNQNKSPDIYAQTWLYLGDALMQQAKNSSWIDKAIDCYAEVIKLEPSCPKSRSLLGILHLHSFNYQNALEEFDKALELMPDNWYILQRQGFTTLKLGQSKEAIKVFKKLKEERTEYLAALWSPVADLTCISSEPEHETYCSKDRHSGTARVLDSTEIKLRLDCLEHFLLFPTRGFMLSAARQRNSNIVSAEELLCESYGLNSARKYENTFKTVDEAIKLCPEFVAAWQHKGRALLEVFETCNTAAAFSYLNALSLNPRYNINLTFLMNLCTAHEHGSFNEERSILDYKKALLTVYDVLLEKRRDWRVLQNKGYSLFRFHEYGEAIAAFEESEQIKQQEDAAKAIRAAETIIR